MWTFVLTDLQGVTLGELNGASERKIALPHMRVPSVSCKVPLTHPRADDLLSTDTLIKAYRTDPNTGAKVLAFHGPTVSAEEVGENLTQSIAVTAAGPLWRLAHRIIPASLQRSGVAYGSPTPANLGGIAHSILTDCNGVTNGFTGIWPGTNTSTNTGTVGVWWRKNAAEGIAELGAGLNSFEYVLTPTEPVNRAQPWPQIATLDCATSIGSTRSDVILEYGTGRSNIASYSRSVSRDGLLTRGHIAVTGWPDSDDRDASVPAVPLRELISSPALTDTTIASRGLFEEMIDDSGMLDNSIRQAVVDFNVAVRQNPRQLITMVPALNSTPSPLTDYFVGDTVRARAVVNGNVRFDALFRIWGITFNVDQNGNEAVELELVMP